MEPLIYAASRAALRTARAAAARFSELPFTIIKASAAHQFNSGRIIDASSFQSPELAQSFSRKYSTTAAATIEPTTSTPIKDRFLKVKHELTTELDEAIKRHGLDRTSFEAGHKIIAFRSTVVSRVHTRMMNENTNPIAKAVEDLGEDETKRRVAANKIYNRFTMHPTEGQNASTIFEKYALVEAITLKESVERDAELYAEPIANFVKIHHDLDEKTTANTPFANEVFRKITEDKITPSKEDFLRATKKITDVLIDKFVTQPIHHTEKMTVDTERKIMLHHLSRCRKDVAKMVAENPDIVAMSDIEFSTWGCDLDGKPHVKPSHHYKLAKDGQKVFFQDLLTSLEAFKTFAEMQGISSDDLISKVIEPIQEIAAEEPLFFGAEAKAQEARITKILEDFAKDHEEASSTLFVEAQNYVKDSGCRVARNMSTTRQEVDKTNKAFDEIAALGDIDDPEIAARTLAENFSKISKESQREILFMMESAMLNEKHEHIISQFDCEVESYRKALRLFQICQHLPQFHETIPELQEYYKDGIYEELFNPASIEAAKKSFVELSPLAEDADTIPKLIDFTREMLSDEEILDYIRRSGGIVRQTRSNSDGSAALGPQAVTYYYLEADIVIKELVEEAGFKFEKLAGIGGNDIARMAPLSEDLMHNQATIQGGDGQHQNIGRLMRMLVRDPHNKSEEAFVDLHDVYDHKDIEDLVEFYRKLHLESEVGLDVELNGKTVKSGQMTSRGTIPGKAVEILGRLSSRPDARSGDVKSKDVVPNEFDRWHDSVYNPQMRRIGATALQDLSGVSTFLTAPFTKSPTEFDAKLVCDFSNIPLVRNTNLSAAFAVGIADAESFLLANGLGEGVSSKAVVENAKNYDEFLELSKTNPELARTFAAQHRFDTPEGIRGGHLSKQICGLKNVLRNALTPLVENCSTATKAQLEEVFQASENGEVTQKYDELATKAFEIMAKDEALEPEVRDVAAYLAQQIKNITRENGYFDTRRKVIKEASEISRKNSKDKTAKFEKACEKLAIIYRSAGNPGSPAGRKMDEGLPFFADCYELRIPSKMCIRPVLIEREAEDLSRC